MNDDDRGPAMSEMTLLDYFAAHTSVSRDEAIGVLVKRKEAYASEVTEGMIAEAMADIRYGRALSMLHRRKLGPLIFDDDEFDNLPTYNKKIDG